MPTIPGTENLSPAIKYVIAFAIIFLLLTLFALILRRLTGARNSLSSDRGRARQPRLGIVDVYDLDRQRQLILLRRDNVEHLLLVGGPNDVVVETNIVRVPGARLPTAQTAEMGENGDAKPGRNGEGSAPRPVVGGTLGPSDMLSVAGPETGALEPVLKPTRVQPTPPPAPAPARPIPARPAPRPSGSNEQDAAVPDMARELEATLRRAQEAQPAQPTPAPVVPIPLPQKPAEPARPAVQAPAAPQVPPRRDPPPAQPAAPSGPPPRQEAPRQEPPRQEPPRQEQPTPQQRPAPVAPIRPAPAAPATPPRQDGPRQETARAEPANQDKPRQEQTRQEPPRQEPPRQEPARPEPPRAAPPAPAAQNKPATAPAPNPKADPFSIEDIEAEFARLLGRPLDKKD